MPRQDDSLSFFKHANVHLTPSRLGVVLRGGKWKERWGLALSVRLLHGVFQGCKQVGLAGREPMFGEGGRENLHLHLGELVGRDNRKEEQITEQPVRPELVGEGSWRWKESKDLSHRLTCQTFLKRTRSQIQQMRYLKKKKYSGSPILFICHGLLMTKKIILFSKVLWPIKYTYIHMYTLWVVPLQLRKIFACNKHLLPAHTKLFCQ